MNTFDTFLTECKTRLRMIANTIAAQNKSDVFTRLKKTFELNFDPYDTESEWVFNWQWRYLAKDNNEESYSDDMRSEFNKQCEKVITQFKLIIGSEATFFSSRSSEYGTLTIRVPQPVNELEERIAAFKEMVTRTEVQVHSTDKVARLEKNSIGLAHTPSTEYVERVTQIASVFGLKIDKNQSCYPLRIEFTHN